MPSADQLVADARKLIPMLKAQAADIERERRVPADVISALADIGLFKLLQPRRFGGYEYGFTEFVRLNLELGQGCGSTAWCATIAMIHNWLVALYPLEAQQDVWSDRDAMVTGAYAPNGTCEAVAGGYRITGRWSFASNCDNSTWAVVCSMLPPAGDGGAPVPGWMLVPRSDFEIEDTWFSAGMAGTGSKTIRIDAPITVPAYRVLTVPVINSGDAPGSHVHANPLYRLSFTGAAPFTLSSVPVGIAKGALEDFTTMARDKMASWAGGPPRPMAGLHNVQIAIADAAAAIDAAELLLLRDTRHMTSRLAIGDLPTLDDRLMFRRDHSYAATQSAHAATVLFEALGANGGDLGSPIQRAWRDTNVAARHISLAWATTGAMYGRHQLGLKPDGTF
ncbi:acyl-CoA dehydrogenase family protein [Sphingosinicella soli]|uniref:Alkylation response protein AidB-like acyl-CoA dehydrogenase n=1 Tax=Sphingosinicella soli TaxID=333708 RepID=A0A7W7B3M1_9SPHN|nr:alkylation response protein AidB-like acyl-CoA dehydrogenase [Sphingosinicella soli]